MSFESETYRKEYTLTSDAQEDIPINFYFLEDEDLSVRLNGDLLVLNTDYSLTGKGVEAGTGEISLVGTGLIGDSLVIIRNPAIVQPREFPATGATRSERIEKGLDYAAHVSQMLQEQIDRCVKIPAEDITGKNQDLSVAAQRAGKFLVFDSEGNVSEGDELGTWRGMFTASTDYDERDMFKSANSLYTCLKDFNTGTDSITTLLAANKIALMLDGTAFDNVQAGRKVCSPSATLAIDYATEGGAAFADTNKPTVIITHEDNGGGSFYNLKIAHTGSAGNWTGFTVTAQAPMTANDYINWQASSNGS